MFLIFYYSEVSQVLGMFFVYHCLKLKLFSWLCSSIIGLVFDDDGFVSMIIGGLRVLLKRGRSAQGLGDAVPTL